MTAAITKIAGRVALLAVVLSLAVSAANLMGQTPGITFAMGSKKTPFDLRIDSQASYNGVAVPSATWALKNLKPHVDKFFNLGDVKPGDSGEATISLHANKDAWVCLEFNGLKSFENGQNEPEALEDSSAGAASGELAEGTNFFAWRDDGDNLFEVGEAPIFGPAPATEALKNKTYPLADWKHGTPLTASSTRYIGLQWCAGDMSVDVPSATIECDGEALGNEAQTDSFAVNVSFEAVSKKDNPKFLCRGHNHHDDFCELPAPVVVNVQNNATIINNTSSSANTGGNSAGAGGPSTGSGQGTVKTGNASATSNTTNVVNTTVISTGSSSSSASSARDIIRNLLRSR